MILKILKPIQPCWKRFCIQVNAVLISFEKGLRVGRTWKESTKTGERNHLKMTSAGVACSRCVPTSCKIIWTCRLRDWPRMTRWKLKFWPTLRTSRPGKKQSQEPFPWMWIPLLRVREKENMIKGKAKVSPKVKTKERVSLRLGQTIHTTSLGTISLGTINLGISSLGINKTPMTPRAKGKARKVKTKVKVKVIKAKVVKLLMLSLTLGSRATTCSLIWWSTWTRDHCAVCLGRHYATQVWSSRWIFSSWSKPKTSKPSSTFKEHCDQERYRHGSERFGISFWV